MVRSNRKKEVLPEPLMLVSETDIVPHPLLCTSHRATSWGFFFMSSLFASMNSENKRAMNLLVSSIIATCVDNVKDM